MDHQQLIDVEVVAARAKLVHRLSELEQRVTATATQTMNRLHEATTDVGGMVKETTNGVRSAVQAVTSNVCETLDMGRQIRTHPWQSLGLAAVAGFLVGIVPHRNQQRNAAAASPSLSSDIWATLRREILGISESLIASGAAALKQSLTASGDDEMDVHGSERPTINRQTADRVMHNGFHR